MTIINVQELTAERDYRPTRELMNDQRASLEVFGKNIVQELLDFTNDQRASSEGCCKTFVQELSLFRSFAPYLDY